jgi:hypothetical protein
MAGLSHAAGARSAAPTRIRQSRADSDSETRIRIRADSDLETRTRIIADSGSETRTRIRADSDLDAEPHRLGSDSRPASAARGLPSGVPRGRLGWCWLRERVGGTSSRRANGAGRAAVGVRRAHGAVQASREAVELARRDYHSYSGAASRRRAGFTHTHTVTRRLVCAWHPGPVRVDPPVHAEVHGRSEFGLRQGRCAWLRVAAIAWTRIQRCPARDAAAVAWQAPNLARALPSSHSLTLPLSLSLARPSGPPL